jgi:nicotinate-nucleotide--dimethylbenzimidazole phosphoribosyltransferase
LAASRAPASAAGVFLSHRSAERGAPRLAALLQEAGCSAAALDLGMRLGEGTGALVALGLLRNAAAIYGMSTLAEAMAL